MIDQKFPKAVRLRSSAQFARVYNANIYAADDCLVMQGKKNDLVPGDSLKERGSLKERASLNENECLTRIGLSVSRKVGNAVVRNKWKRLIREAFRVQKFYLPQGIDLVLRPRKGAEPDFRTIKTSLICLAERIERKLRKSNSAVRKS